MAERSERTEGAKQCLSDRAEALLGLLRCGPVQLHDAAEITTRLGELQKLADKLREAGHQVKECPAPGEPSDGPMYWIPQRRLGVSKR